MKKVVILMVVFVLFAGCVTAFADSSSSSSSEKGGFFMDMKRLFEEQIPNTPKEKSKTHTIWEQTPGRGKESK